MGYADELYAELAPEVLEPALGVEVLHYPGGRGSAGALPPAIPRTVLLAIDALLGTNEWPGDGAITVDQSGNNERRTGYLQISKNVTVTDKDLWGIHGLLWTTQRMDGADAHATKGYQAWRITYTKPDRTSRPLGKDLRSLRS